jgi:UDP-N-acetyl-2-amino-2-deoxyglucuronate dehydrogenase
MRTVGPTEVRFGLIGCGGIGRWHARSLATIPGVKLVGVTDSNPDAAAEASRLSSAPVFATLDALLAQDDIDVVTVCTPPHTHAPIVAAAARAGKHVLVEKPLAPTLAEADQAIAICQSAAVHLGVVLQQRARSATRAIHRLVTDGTLGRILFANATHTWYRSQQQFDREAWRGGAAPGGGFLLDQCTHAVDLLIWLLGEPRWVSAGTSALVIQGHGEDTVVATLGFESGALGTLSGSTAANSARDDIALELSGSCGGFRLEIRDYDNAEIVALSLSDSTEKRARSLSEAEIESLIQRERGEWRKGPRSLPWRFAAALAGPARGSHPFRSPRAWLRRQADRVAQVERHEPQGHAAILAQMAAAIRGGEAPLVTGHDARRSLAVLEAMARSQAAGGQRVTVSRQ